MQIDWLSEEWINETKNAMASDQGKDFKKFYSNIKNKLERRPKKDIVCCVAKGVRVFVNPIRFLSLY